MRVPIPEASMNERIYRIPRQPRIKLSSPPSVFLWPPRLCSLAFKAMTMGISPWRQREAVVCAAILKTQKQHPPSFHWVTFSFPTVKNWWGYRARHTGTVERRGEKVFQRHFSSMAPCRISGSVGWHLCVVWSQGQPPLQNEKVGHWWFSFADNGCFLDVGWMHLTEGSAISVLKITPSGSRKGILCAYCVQGQRPWPVLSTLGLEKPTHREPKQMLSYGCFCYSFVEFCWKTCCRI